MVTIVSDGVPGTHLLLSPQPPINALHIVIQVCSHNDVECDRGGSCECTSYSVIASPV